MVLRMPESMVCPTKRMGDSETLPAGLVRLHTRLQTRTTNSSNNNNNNSRDTE